MPTPSRKAFQRKTAVSEKGTAVFLFYRLEKIESDTGDQLFFITTPTPSRFSTTV